MTAPAPVVQLLLASAFDPAELGLWVAARLLWLLRSCNIEEFLLIGAAVALARLWRKPWDRLFTLARKRSAAIAAHPVLAYASLPIAAALLRLALLPFDGVPLPAVPDEFSHLFLAATLKSGRLANPTHPLWQHFETIHIFHTPTYSSMYLPGQALFLALGHLVFGHPWFGVLLSAAFMVLTLHWMLRGWFSPGWAYFGAAIAALRFGVDSYWVNSYWGGCVPAAGGALVLGAWPRLVRRPSAWNGALLGIGAGLLLLSRPLEGGILTALALAALAIALSKRGRLRSFVRQSAAAAAVPLLLCGGFLAEYCRVVTGSPFVFPYVNNQKLYGWPLTLPLFTPAPNVTHRHPELKQYLDWELIEHQRISSLAAVIRDEDLKFPRLWQFFLGPALTPVLLFLPAAARSRKIRLPVAAAILLLIVVGREQSSYPHYLSPAAGVLLIILVQCMRHMRASGMTGRRFVAALPVILAAMVVVHAAAPLNPSVRDGRGWCCRTAPGALRAGVVRHLLQMPGAHVVFVHYNRPGWNTNEWVYNDPDIDRSRIVWARDMGPAENSQVLDYYPGRRAWSVEAEDQSPRLVPYPPLDGQGAGDRTQPASPSMK